jgi:ArsR family transcriptional regulator
MNKEIYKFKTSIVKALANPIRLMIVDCLRSGEKCVSEIIEAIGEEQSTISKSLGVLKAHHIIKDRKNGLNVYYSLKICCIDKFLNGLDMMIAENSEHQQELINSLNKE